MPRMIDFIRKILRLPAEAPKDPAALRDSFARHYRRFRALLTANNNALDLMAGLERTLRSGRPFGMAFVRGHCTALTVNVYKMIRNLQDLSEGKYGGLTQSFEAVSSGLDSVLARQPAGGEGKFIMPLAEIDKGSADQVGEKMANLGEIRNRVGLKVPAGFVVTAAASRHFIRTSELQDEINRRLKTLDTDDLEDLHEKSRSIQHLIGSAPLPSDLEEEIKARHQRLAAEAGAGVLVALRSSAVGEDGAAASFAGQYRTQLNVDAETVCQIYKEIVASKYQSQAIIYRLQRGFRHQDVTMCVGCLAMVDAVTSGVIYSRSPEDPRSAWLVINAAPGLAIQVVEGSAATDIFHVERKSPHAIISRKARSREAEGAPCLADEQARELARLAVRLENHFGSPQDIEWSIDGNGEIVILQSRPLGRHAVLDHALPAPAEAEAGREEEALLSGGITASRGVAAGPVHVVHDNDDLLHFPKGAVLAVHHPLPEWATILNRAAAVVSETGQVAAHLATVAREFGIPAIFGADDALQKLHNGEIVTVDATGCRVHAGRREDLLAHAAPPPNLMAGSPIARLLREALTLITPLNLTDPASPFFRPSSCKTFHDITRFCHEKAVAEMFSFGERHRFDEKTAKQLVGETPFKWWVINLDDGFGPGSERYEKFIHIDDIVSVPMLAIWEGMLAIPWKGPPPVSLRGFGSIIFQSTVNPNLDPAVRSSLTARNYFLVARNFCNLSVRLGYHFSLVEAYLGDLLTESYVSFQFKGGAADERRRFMRVNLLKEVLRRFDFRVEQKVDALAARIEKKPKPFLIDRLKVLGYLLIHTRQIDMVMGDDAMVERYRWKILEDLNTIVGG